ncbi:nicotinamide mononucleotide adenylyltransferase [Gracilaria domingensis]|nr:nicotinamide mononucleotide adenylyltransferase [Gracilaria domingensis]
MPAAVLLQIGSFSPITHAHMRLFDVVLTVFQHRNRETEAATDSLKQLGYHVCGGYLSPANDAYKKASLVPARHRLAMCRLALRELDHIVLDDWEARSSHYVQSYDVANRIRAAVVAWSKNVQLFLVCGSDLLLSMANSSSWPRQSAIKLANCCRFIVKARNGPKPDVANLVPFVKDVTWIDAWVGDHSSTLVRQHLRRGHSIAFMTPTPVIDYIRKHHLYR